MTTYEILNVSMRGDMDFYVSEWTVVEHDNMSDLPLRTETQIGQITINIHRTFVMLLPAVEQALTVLVRGNHKVKAIVTLREISRGQGTVMPLAPAKTLVEWLAAHK